MIFSCSTCSAKYVFHIKEENVAKTWENLGNIKISSCFNCYVKKDLDSRL